MRLAAILIGKGLAVASRRLGRGSGTSYPGLVAEKMHPALIHDLASHLPRGTALVSGTNGKTTTSKMLADALRANGHSVVTNGSGSNLRHGVASALIAASDSLGIGMRGDIGVLEIDEAAMRTVAPMVWARTVCVTNLFRDQLDRFGDTDSTAALLGEALALSPGSVAVLNADDPVVAGLDSYAANPAFFGITASSDESATKVSGTETAPCPHCGAPVEFATRSYAHLGDWRCPACKTRRPRLEFHGHDVALSPTGSAFTFTCTQGSVRIVLPVPGLHNVYNALAACACGVTLGIPLEVLASSLAGFEPAFGRSERFEVEGRHVVLALAKNPVGAQESMRTLGAESSPTALGFALNDNDADGRDVSWIWDVDFEALNVSGTRMVLSGSRAEDLAVRLKYAGVARNRLTVCRDPARAVRSLADLMEPGETVHQLASYTAMLEIRDSLVPSDARFAHLGKELRHVR